MRREIENALDGLFAFGRTALTTQARRTREVLVRILGDKRADGREERHDDQSMWIASPLLYRAARPTAEGQEENLFLRRGNEAVILGTRDLRWIVELDEGEAVVRGLGPDAARLRLRADGSAVLEARLEVRDARGQVRTRLATEEGVKAEFAKVATTLGTGSNGAGAVVFATPYTGTTADIGTDRISVDE